MTSSIKSQAEILNKLGISKLNPMQEEAIEAIKSNDSVILLSPTGTGKTLAFLLPIIAELELDCKEVQALILTPSRELAIQIEQVIRDMGAGFKANAVYGGRPIAKDFLELNHKPHILIGTPGRIADHIRRGTFSIDYINMMVLDEYDKSLEIGFEGEMMDIIDELPNIQKRILTSATAEIEIPKYVGLKDAKSVNYLDQVINELKLKTIISPSKDKLETLVAALSHLGNEPGIIFCNFKDSIQRVSDYLYEHKINHGCFYGGMEQQDRERALIKFRNGTHQLIIATDLAARGIDVPEIKFIIHYHLPLRSQEFVHRNGRTARMNSEGTAYILKWEKEELPDFIDSTEIEEIKSAPLPKPSKWATLFISGGRRDKISKGDIAGFLIKKGNLKGDEVGVIELKQECSFVAIPESKIYPLIKTLNNTFLKKRKVRITKI